MTSHPSLGGEAFDHLTSNTESLSSDQTSPTTSSTSHLPIYFQLIASSTTKLPMHPVLHLFLAYETITYLSNIRAISIMLLYSGSGMHELDCYIARTVQINNYLALPLMSILLCDMIAGTVFDLLHICDLIDHAWELVLRRGRTLLNSCWGHCQGAGRLCRLEKAAW